MITILLLIINMFSCINVLFFVGSENKLPEPLSKEAEEFYIVMAQDGDIMAKDKLIEQ